ncbi:uncharacterized protein TNCV_2299981 [Trichonephila clavipes]|nr:uncharacterized protein TNCV_2299981 [Trichonephila clavipes]
MESLDIIVSLKAYLDLFRKQLSKHQHKTFICKRCLSAFQTEYKLLQHNEMCIHKKSCKGSNAVRNKKSSVRGGISQCCNRYAIANNRYMSNFNPDDEIKYLMYLDANNLYGYAMSKYLPLKDFVWSDNDLTEQDILNISDESDVAVGENNSTRPLNSKIKANAGEKQFNSSVGTKQLNSTGENNSTRQHERNNSTGENNSTQQQERTTQLGSRNETTQLASRNETTQLINRNETPPQLSTAVDRLQPPATAYNRLQPPAPPAPPLQQNRLFLPTNMLEFLPCPVPLCVHNFKYNKNNKKRTAEPITRPSKLTAKINENKLDDEDFKIPRKTAKILNTANDDVEEFTPAAPKIKPVMMKLFPEYNLILQEIHRTRPTATNTHIGGYIKIQAESSDHHREITQFLTDKGVQYYVTDPPANRPLKLVIKGLLATTEPEEIKKDLIDQGIKIEKIAQLRQFKTKSPLPFFMIEITRDENVDDIFKIRSCLYMQVKFDPFRKNSRPTQCYNCNFFPPC